MCDDANTDNKQRWQYNNIKIISNAFKVLQLTTKLAACDHDQIGSIIAKITIQLRVKFINNVNTPERKCRQTQPQKALECTIL